MKKYILYIPMILCLFVVLSACGYMIGIDSATRQSLPKEKPQFPVQNEEVKK